jgi:5-methylcytosine-specific restriction enzyme subunit McrC
MSEIAVCLNEWERRDPDPGTPLAGLALEDAAAHALARQLSASNKLEILELAQGIAIRTTSFVGRVRLGRLCITVQPKIVGAPLSVLLRYAYGLRHLDLFPRAGYDAATSPFQDLLIHQLATKTAELIGRGLHREYVRTPQTLASPRGRLDFQTYARQGGTAQAALPCIHHPRLASTLINQALLAGLYLGVRLTDDLILRAQLRRLAQILETDVRPVRLDGAILTQAHRALDRRTSAYRPALTLIELLLQATGLVLDEQETALQLPGFLFDMNHFFQALLARFLQEHLAGYTLREEHRLKGMLAYVHGHNPRRRRAPEPRPDFVILQQSKTVAILDAKYRDLWEHSLPRDMLYQLVIYALSQPLGTEAAILYPTLDAAAQPARIAIRDPRSGGDRAYIVLRPVDLLRLRDLLTDHAGYRQRQACAAFARYLTFGQPSESHEALQFPRH